MRPAGKLGVSGALAGLACGLFGGGGGMVLAPLLLRVLLSFCRMPLSCILWLF